MIKTFSSITTRSPLPTPAHSADGPPNALSPKNRNASLAVVGDLSVTMRSRLSALPFAAYARFVSDVLTAAGYESVQARGRDRFLGKNASGGVDLTATLPGSLGVRPVIAQLKQLAPDASVSQRYVDELRGCCLRTGAAEALLVTTGVFSPIARENATRTAHSPVAPVRLLDGEALVCLAVQYGIGTQKDREGIVVGDDAYFAALEERFSGKEVRKRTSRQPEPSRHIPPPSHPAPALVRRMAGPVTVTVVVRDDEKEDGR